MAGRMCRSRPRLRVGASRWTDLDGLRYSPPEPIHLPKEHRDAALIHGVSSLLHMEAHRRGGSVMFFVAGVEPSLRLSHVYIGAVVALDLIHYSCLV